MCESSWSEVQKVEIGWKSYHVSCHLRLNLTKHPELCSSLPSFPRYTSDETDKFQLVLQLHVADSQHHISGGSGTVHTDPVCERCASGYNLRGGVLVVDVLPLTPPCHLKVRDHTLNTWRVDTPYLCVHLCIGLGETHIEPLYDHGADAFRRCEHAGDRSCFPPEHLHSVLHVDLHSSPRWKRERSDKFFIIDFQLLSALVVAITFTSILHIFHQGCLIKDLCWRNRSAPVAFKPLSVQFPPLTIHWCRYLRIPKTSYNDIADVK